ncbi:hypothetical protein PTSG_01613 [Salpingoeca rosetta]|uniref:VLIG-type G domain-containing protein n=1 Tax=Salpingoeca rosetta (strain ATCC 50818 / BSB-021) TaxID=946362 RepID=F2TYG1_SALR5|nr:uncharacterized protein PTSG_01613 [Salpingoeca rosetta]EGD78635.1 hypothetical protein PTSG_01613 [Salpingoeca rosetta]|eukprot:XP_004997593.1 hypothetical protein PTSG_01613 [Salpingoeca rosetta]
MSAPKKQFVTAMRTPATRDRDHHVLEQPIPATDMDTAVAEQDLPTYVGYQVHRGFEPSLPPALKAMVDDAMAQDSDDSDSDSSSDDDDDSNDKGSEKKAKDKPAADSPKPMDEKLPPLPQVLSLCDATLQHLHNLPNDVARGVFVEKLLARHMAVPIWAQQLSPKHADDKYKHHVSALQFANLETKTTPPTVNTYTDKGCLRVVVMSKYGAATTSTPQLLKDLFHIDSLHEKDKRTDFTVTKHPSLMEVGVGYLKEPAKELGTRPTTHPCLVLHVIGDYEDLWPGFLRDFVDVVILEHPGTPGKAKDEPIFNASLDKKRCFAWHPKADAHDAPKSKKDDNHHVVCGQLRDPKTNEKMVKRLVKATAKLQEEFGLQPMDSSTASTGSSGTSGSSPSTDTRARLTLFDLCRKNTELFPRLPPFAVLPVVEHDFSQVRGKTFVLQESFKRERDASESKNSRSNVQKRAKKDEDDMFDQDIQQQRDYRGENAHYQLGVPLVQRVIQIASQPRAKDRVVGFHMLQHALALKSSQQLQRLEEEVARLKKASNKNPDNEELRKQYLDANASINDYNVTLDHIWREIGHIYAAVDCEVDLPKLAAQHILDGYPLELFDGDALGANEVWVGAVLGQLDEIVTLIDVMFNSTQNKPPTHLDHSPVTEMLKAQCQQQQQPGGYTHDVKPRVMVHSMFGPQSSGKSTTANHMYGTRLKASVGRCTIGVNMQLIPCKGREEYDYVLLLDTEGVRAPEFTHMEKSNRRDGVFALIAFLLADTTTVVIPSENDRVVRELLPIVLDAYRDSKMAEAKGGQLSTKVVFVYNKMDSANKDRMTAQTESLQTSLQEAEDKVLNGDKYLFAELKAIEKGGSSDGPEQSRHEDKNDPPPSTQLFTRDLKCSLEDPMQSDVHVIGQLKTGDYPPDDKPQDEYATAILQLRLYTHDRVTQQPRWQARSLQDFKALTTKVWDCLDAAHFAVSFVSIVEKQAYARMTMGVTLYQKKLAKVFRETFEGIETQVLAKSVSDDEELTEVQIMEQAEKWWCELEGAAYHKQQSITGDVSTFLTEFEQWQPSQLLRWQDFVDQQHKHWKALLISLVGTHLGSEKKEKSMQQQLRQELKARFSKYSGQDCSKEKVREEFNKWFKPRLDEIRQQHPPVADCVREKMKNACCDFAAGDKQLIEAMTADESSVRADQVIEAPKDAKTREPKPSKWGAFLAFFALRRRAPSDGVNARTVIDELAQSVVESALEGHKCYSDDIVSDALHSAQKRAAELHIKGTWFLRGVLHAVCAKLQPRLVKLQRAWDRKHSIHPSETDRVHEKMLEACCDFAAGDKQLFDVMTADESPVRADHVINMHKRKQSTIGALLSGIVRRQARPEGVNAREVIDELAQFVVERALEGHKCYSDDIVSDALHSAKQRAVDSDCTEEWFKRGVLHAVYTRLQPRLVKLQQAWDKKHNMYHCIQNAGASLFEFAVAIVEGLKGVKLLEKNIVDALKKEWYWDFLGSLARTYAIQVVEESFISNTTVLCALVDLDLLRLHDEGDEATLLRKVERTDKHFEEMSQRMTLQYFDQPREGSDPATSHVQQHMDTYMKRVKLLFQEVVLPQDAKLPATETLQQLRRSAAANKLTGLAKELGCFSVPDGADENSNVDDLKEMLERIVRVLSKQGRNISTQQKKWLSNRVAFVQELLGRLTEQQYVGARSAKPRCGERCPVCGYPCMRERGHLGVKSSGKHDSHDCAHQPASFSGSVRYRTDELWPRSCLTSVRDGCDMVFDDKTVPFKDFDKQYPTWKVPNIDQPQHLREYLYYHHVEAAAHKYGRSPSESREACPVTYNHNRTQVERELNAIVGNYTLPPPL